MNFVELNIHTEGVGDYHINRHRAYFLPKSPLVNRSSNQNELGRKFAEQFCSYFNANNKNAQVRFGTRKWDLRRTLQFEGAVRPLGINNWITEWLCKGFHSDWVGVLGSNGGRGMSVQTLKRQFAEQGDKKTRLGLVLAGALSGSLIGIKASTAPAAASLGIAGALAANRVADLAVEINKMHFLAGRRSWVVQPALNIPDRPINLPSQSWCIETAAIERFSNVVVAKTDDFEILGSLQQQVKQIWTTLLLNFLRMEGAIQLNRTHWEEKNQNVSLQFRKFKSVNALIESDIFKQVTAVHPDLYSVS